MGQKQCVSKRCASCGPNPNPILYIYREKAAPLLLSVRMLHYDVARSLTVPLRSLIGCAVPYCAHLRLPRRRRYEVNGISQMQGGKTGLCRKIKMQTGSSETLIGRKFGINPLCQSMRPYEGSVAMDHGLGLHSRSCDFTGWWIVVTFPCLNKWWNNFEDYSVILGYLVRFYSFCRVLKEVP